jgi:hypothetical protein
VGTVGYKTKYHLQGRIHYEEIPNVVFNVYET